MISVTPGDFLEFDLSAGHRMLRVGGAVPMRGGGGGLPNPSIQDGLL